MINAWLTRSQMASARGLRTTKGSSPAIRWVRSWLQVTPPMKAAHTSTRRGNSSAQCGVVCITKRSNTT